MKRLLSETPCGCEQYSDAQSARPGEREALLRVCGGNAERWGCPRAGEGAQITERHTDALRAVERLTGCDRGSLNTCPRYEAHRPDVVRALRLYRATQGGGVTFDDDPPAAIVVASEAIGGADAKRIEREQQERREREP